MGRTLEERLRSRNSRVPDREETAAMSQESIWFGIVYRGKMSMKREENGAGVPGCKYVCRMPGAGAESREQIQEFLKSSGLHLRIRSRVGLPMTSAVRADGPVKHKDMAGTQNTPRAVSGGFDSVPLTNLGERRRRPAPDAPNNRRSGSRRRTGPVLPMPRLAPREPGSEPESPG